MSGDDGKSMDDEEFERFVLENMNRIRSVMMDQESKIEDRESDDISRAERFAKERIDDAQRFAKDEKSKFEEFAKDKRAKSEDVIKDIFLAVTNPTVQKHFITMGIEFMMGMQSLIEAMPFPDSVKVGMDVANEAKDSFTDNYCDVNTKCKYKKKDGVEKIELD